MTSVNKTTYKETINIYNNTNKIITPNTGLLNNQPNGCFFYID